MIRSSLLILVLASPPLVGQCNPPETLGQAVVGVFGSGAAAAALSTDDLIGLGAADLARLFAASPAARLSDAIGSMAPRISLESGPGNGVTLGQQGFRAPALTPNAAAAGVHSEGVGSQFLTRSYASSAFADGCPALVQRYDHAPQVGPDRRRRDEIRAFNPQTWIGVAYRDADLDFDGRPVAAPAVLDRFFAVDLRSPAPYVAPAGTGWPWSGTTPGGALAPPTWSRPYPVAPGLYPFADRLISLRFGDLHYVDESPSNPQGTVLLLHGNPTWSFLYRDVITSLTADGFRVLAPDLPGFGFSPRHPAFPGGPGDYLDVLEDFVHALDLNDIVLAIHDWGGSLGVALASHLRPRIRGLVLMNTWAWNIDPATPGAYHFMADWSNDNSINSASYLATGAFPKLIAESLAGLHGVPSSPAWVALRDAYLGPYFDLATLAPLAAAAIAPTNDFAIDVLRARDHHTEVENSLPRLADLPAYLLFGSLDPAQGALVADPNASPSCPPGTMAVAAGGTTYCLDAQGRRVHPYLDRLLSAWSPAAVVGAEIVSSAGHFVAEHVPLSVSAAVRSVHGFLGAGCGARAGAPRIAAEQAKVGQSFSIGVADAAAGGSAFILVSAQTSASSFGPCSIYIDLSNFLDLGGALLVNSGGRASTTLAVPNAPALLGVAIHAQGAVVSAQGQIANAVDLTGGRRLVFR